MKLFVANVTILEVSSYGGGFLLAVWLRTHLVSHL